MPSHYNSKREIKSKVITNSVKKSSTSAGFMRPHGNKVLIRSQKLMSGGPSA